MSASDRVNALFGRLNAVEKASRNYAESVDSMSTLRRGASSAQNGQGAGGSEATGAFVDDYDVGAKFVEPTTLCNGMRVVPEGASAKRGRTYNISPMSVDSIHKQMGEMEAESSSSRKKMPQMTSSASRLGVSYADDDDSTAETFPEGWRGRVTYNTQTFAEHISDSGLSGLEGLDGVMTNAARENRKKQQEEERAAKQANRARRQELADSAKLKYGMTIKEKKERKNREIKLEQQAFAATQATAGRDFVRRGRNIVIFNLIALCSQVLFVMDMYQAKLTSEAPPGGMQEAPVFVFIYTMCGICGSFLALLSVVILSAVLFSQGLKSKNLQIVCPIAVYSNYMSSFLQLLSLFNHIGYIATSYDRLISMYPGPADQPVRTVMIVAQMVLVPILPFIMIFTIAQTKFMCYSNLKKLIAAAVIQKHIYRSIGICQIGSSGLVLTICGMNMFSTMNELSNDQALAADQPAWGYYLINYTKFLFPCAGIVGFLSGVFYLHVTSSMLTYEIDEMHLEENKESSMLAGQRVPLEKGNHCKLQYLVDKPSLNGQRATIESAGTDDQGKVAVSVEGRELKVEEFQITVMTSEKELEETIERAKLKTAELVYKFDQRGETLKAKQMLYVTIGQVMIGLLAQFIIQLLLQSRYAALSLFDALVRRVPTEYIHSGMIGAMFQESKQRALINIQQELCPYWSRCFEGFVEGREQCGECEIPLPSTVSLSQLSKPTFAAGDIFSGPSLRQVILFSIIGGGGGLIFSIIFVRCIAKQGLCTTLIATIPIVVLFGIIGTAAAPLPTVFTTHEALSRDQCRSLDLDPNLEGDQRVGLDCLYIAASHSYKDSFEIDARLSTTGVLVNAFVFLFESLSNLARAIRATGPTQWARFEVKVFMIYFIGVAVCLLVANLLYNKTTLLEKPEEVFVNNTRWGALLAQSYGENFPLYLDERWSMYRQLWISKRFWFKFELTVPTLAVAVSVNLTALVAACFAAEHVWVMTMRIVLVIDTFLLLSLYLSMAIMSVVVVNLVQNIQVILVIPLVIQYCFAMLYALQSDILPIFKGLPRNPVLAAVVVAYICMPVIGIILLVVGASILIFYGSSEGVPVQEPPITPPISSEELSTLSTSLMAVGGSMLGLFLLVLVVAGARRACEYYDDWTQMAADKLAEWYPQTFGRKREDDSEEDSEEMETIDKDKAGKI